MTRNHGTLLAGIALLTAAGVFFLEKSASAPVGRTAAGATRSQKSDRPPLAGKAAAPQSRLADLPPPVPSPHAPGSPEDREWAAARMAELEDLAHYDDAGSLEKILAELRNPLPEIRAAALAATRAFGSRDAVPWLTALAAESRVPEEQRAISALIDYLNLPTLIEKSDMNAVD